MDVAYSFKRWLMFPARFAKTAYQVLAEPGFVTAASKASEEEGTEPEWNELDPVAPQAFFVFSMLLPWRAVDTINRLEESDSTLDAAFGAAREFFALELDPWSLLVFLLVPILWITAWRLRRVIKAWTKKDLPAKECRAAIAYVYGAALAAMIPMCLVGAGLFALTTLGVPGDPLFVLVVLLGLGLMMAVLQAMASATGMEDIEAYMVLLTMAAPWMGWFFLKIWDRD